MIRVIEKLNPSVLNERRSKSSEAKRFSDRKIFGVLKEREAGPKVDDICRRNGINLTTFYTRRKKYGESEATAARRLLVAETSGRGYMSILGKSIVGAA
jgi:putative transposase